jgi:hypothetical protein
MPCLHGRFFSDISKSIKEFRAWAENYDKGIVNLATALGIPPEAMQAFQEVKNLWLAADAAAEDPLTATKAAMHERVRMMGVYTKTIRTFNNEYVSHNHRLTPQQREQLGLPPVNPPSPQPAPTKRPHVEITTEAPGQVNIHCFGEETKWGMEEGVHGYEWGYVISDQSLNRTTNSPTPSFRPAHTTARYSITACA